MKFLRKRNLTGLPLPLGGDEEAFLLGKYEGIVAYVYMVICPGEGCVFVV